MEVEVQKKMKKKMWRENEQVDEGQIQLTVTTER